MTELAIRAASLPEKITYARGLADSAMLPAQYRKNPANVLWAIEYGETLGITPMAAITGVHVIEGKPSASAALISGLVRRAGHKLRVTGNSKAATAQIIRSDDPDYTFEVTFTIEDARTAGLANKAVWKNYPAAMLKSRAITQVARDACEEILFGLHYTPEELGADVDADGNVVPDVPSPERRAERQQPTAPVVDQWTAPAPPAPQPLDDGIEDAEIVGEDTAPPAAAEPKRPTKNQLTHLAIEFGNHGVTDRDERLRHTSQLLGRDVTSFTTLTVAEHDTIRKALRGGWPHIDPSQGPGPAPGEYEFEDNPVRDILATGIADAASPATLDQAGRDIAGELTRGTITPAEAEFLRTAWKARSKALAELAAMQQEDAGAMAMAGAEATS